MSYDFTSLQVIAENEESKKAAALFCDEIAARASRLPENDNDAPVVEFRADESFESKDSFRIKLGDRRLTLTAKSRRGLIYAYSYFLRKCVFDDERVTLIKDISGFYSPVKEVRGHQCGYRSTPNTYDAWDVSDYRRYYLDMMAFGSNVCEHIPQWHESARNRLMKYSSLEMAREASAAAEEFDLDVSCWIPNEDDEINDEELALERKKIIFETLPRLDRVFIPGGDPGSMEGDAFVERGLKISELLKRTKPLAQLWLSAQAPHSKPDWGDRFLAEIKKEPDGVDGLIMGPNHAWPLEEMRRLVPGRYPVCLYPDITHNVRCEYPVHFDRDDWHFSLASAFSRESVNPRPREFRLLHELTAPYVIGSVSYSEGVHDDVNKAVWGDADFFGKADLRETVEDYCRFFMWQGDAEILADCIFGLEAAWEGDPVLNPAIENDLKALEEQAVKHPALTGNWRFLLLLFRARCDAIVRRRRIFELGLINEAKALAGEGRYAAAREALGRCFDHSYSALRRSVDDLAEKLFSLIGIQLDCEHYHTDSWERGATLDTLDRPVTDRAWLLGCFRKADRLPPDEARAYIKRVFSRNDVESDETYFSFAENELAGAGERQTGEFYMDFMGDRPFNDGRAPTCTLKCYDHFTFACRCGGFTPGKNYRLRVSFVKNDKPTDSFTVKANGRVIYRGGFYGGEKDELFDLEMLADGFVSATYELPAEVFENGCLRLEMSEDRYGVEFCEFKIFGSDKA